jgi:beta-lactamase class D
MRIGAARSGASAALLAALTSLASQAAPPSPPLDTLFEGFSACALIDTRDRYDETHLEYHPSQCVVPLSPCSTFKIPHALIGLETGTVDGPEHLKAWDGRVRERTVTNRDHTLASAVEHSVVWYFQGLAREIGAAQMQHWLDRLQYGNRDVTAGIDRFWLGSSLRIDAYQQLQLIRSLWRDGLPFDHAHQQAVRVMLRQDSPLPGTMYGKTGSCLGDPQSGVPDHGWFIGWIEWEPGRERNPATSWFVIRIVGDRARGWTARDLTLELLRHLQP